MYDLPLVKPGLSAFDYAHNGTGLVIQLRIHIRHMHADDLIREDSVVKPFHKFHISIFVTDEHAIRILIQLSGLNQSICFALLQHKK